MGNKCEHKWVDMEGGTLDQFCVRCSLKQMQGMLNPISADLGTSMSMPLGRGRMEIPHLTPSGEHTRVSVYKDDLIKRMNEEMGLSINHFSNLVGR